MTSKDSDPEAVLRLSLDAIDGVRRRIMLAGYLAVAVTAGAFLWLDHVARTSANTKPLIMAAVFAVISVIAWSTFALAIFITRMTKRILRAIDVASRSERARP
jgi:hypothetical protein